MTGARVGIDLGGTKIEGIRLGSTGTVAERRRIATPKRYSATVEAVAAVVAELDPEGAAPVGIGTPGAWVESSRTMKNCNSTWLNGEPLLDDLNAALGGRVRIANDANCFALSEAQDGAGRGAGVVFGVILGTGVGGGVVVDGKLLPGANGIAGEWGHTPLPYFQSDPASPSEARLAHRPCYCGRVDCIETFLSGPGLAGIHKELTGRDAGTAAIAPDAPTLHLYTTMLARALAQIVNILDPDVIVLGGGVSNIARLTVDLPAKLPRYGFAYEGRTRIVRAAHGDASGVRGAARLWPG
jgi:fructokinase